MPLLETSDLLGGLHIPGDGYANPTDVTLALAAGARAAGARIVEQAPVTAVRTAGGRVVGVTTNQGDIDADCIVLCAGMWTRELAASIGVNVPLHACEHYYVPLRLRRGDSMRTCPSCGTTTPSRTSGTTRAS